MSDEKKLEGDEEIEKRREGSKAEFHKLLVKEVMKWEFPMIERSASIETVAKILRSRQHVWIVDKPGSKRVIGTITERDFLEVMSPLPGRSWVVGKIKPKSWHHAEFETAEDLMVKHLVTCSQDATIEEALSLMSRHRVSRLPIIGNDELIGEVNLSALINAYIAKVEESSE
jgi:CBS domain-containing protein